MARIVPVLLVLIGSIAYLQCSQSAPTAPLTNSSETPMISPEFSSTASNSSPPQQPQKSRSREQTAFSAEEGINHPVSVPDDVLPILRTFERIQGCLTKGKVPDQIPPSWFLASEIHLKDGGSPDLVVMPANRCLFGANIVPFWVFRNTIKGHQLVLSESDFILELLKTRTNGYRDIRMVGLTATEELITIYKFEGRKYAMRRSYRRPIRA
jgi:hypothetical protein